MTKEENDKRLEYLKSIVKRLPDKPSSYQFYDGFLFIIELIAARFVWQSFYNTPEIL